MTAISIWPGSPSPLGATFSDRGVNFSLFSEHVWASGFAQCLGMGLPGDQIAEVDEHGERIMGDSFAILFNAHDKAILFRLGTRQRDVRWTCVFDTAAPDAPPRTFEHMREYPLQSRSLAVLRAEPK